MQALNRNQLPFFISFVLSLHFLPAYSQEADTIVTGSRVVVIPGKHYSASGIKKFFWGKHYRKEWTTPAAFPILNLDTALGGLTPVEKGGGRQTKNLRLKTSDSIEYVLRSVDKNFQSAIPEIAYGTIVEDIVNDQVSTEHPYAAVTIPLMAEAAGIYHTNPGIVFLPKSDRLGEFNTEFADQLYLFEERPDDDQSHAPTFGNSHDVISTEKMMENITAHNNHYIDQAFFVRCRLFDMFAGDWGRHEDQWRWASFDTAGGKYYRAIPRDRDQAYTLFDGLMVSLLKSTVQYGLESFDNKINNIEKYNYPARFLDRRFTNNVTMETWVSIANDLKSRLTDQVIEASVKKLPAEVYGISGETIIKKLKSRRDDLDKYARKYYRFLSEVIDIPGSHQNERFEVIYQGGDSVNVNVYRLGENNQKGEIIYSRSISEKETREIRLYGLEGNDQFYTDGEGKTGIRIRLVGGPVKDSYESAPGKEGFKVKVYDNRDNMFESMKDARLRLSADPDVHEYNYKAFQYNRRGFKKGISYNNKDRIFLRTGYYIQRTGWRKLPFGYRQDLNLNYSVWQKAFSVQYSALFIQAIGKWNIALDGEFDAVRDFVFPGVGNESKVDVTTRGYYRIRTKEYYFNAGLNRDFQRFHQVGFYGFYQGFKLLYDDEKLISQYPKTDSIFNTRNYAGISGYYNVLRINDPVIPTKGAGFSTEVGYTHPLDKTAKPFFRLTGRFGFYLPLLHNLTLASTTSAATVTEDTDFNQLNRLGGGASFRGYQRFRFYGRTSFLNSNELQWIMDVKSHIMNGKLGLIGFFDNGRVWQTGEISNTWHISYGGGLLLAPFNKIVLVGTYGITTEGGGVNFRLGRFF